jgi:hypothetical protein
VGKIVGRIRSGLNEVKFIEAGKLSTKSANHSSMNFEVRVTPHFEREVKVLAKRNHSFQERHQEVNRFAK